MLTRQQARDFYDRFGRRQDRQSFYERRPIDRMVELGDFGSAEAVVEFGCGTGTFAQRLMDEELPSNATYAGFDLSETMTKMTRRRLVPYGARVSVTRTDGRPRIPLPPDSCDRFVSNYVLDLLPIGDITRTLDQAYKVLRPDGLLCLTSLTFGTNALSKMTIAVWLAVHSLKPSLVGGVPADLAQRLSRTRVVEGPVLDHRDRLRSPHPGADRPAQRPWSGSKRNLQAVCSCGGSGTRR